MNEYAILSFHAAIILFGVILMTPLGEFVGGFLVNKWPSTSTKRGRMLAGLMLVCTGGFTVSAHTLWMHNKLSEGGSVCSGSSFSTVTVLLEILNTIQFPSLTNHGAFLEWWLSVFFFGLSLQSLKNHSLLQHQPTSKQV